MRVTPRIIIDDAKLTSSTVPEIASAAYNSGTTYALGAYASVAGSAGLITEYKSLQAANIGHAPASSPDWWLPVGTTYQVYDAGATYAAFDRVIDPVAHDVYQSAVDGNTGNALSDDTKWTRIGKTNRMAMFDLSRTAPTVSPEPVTVVITPGQRCDAVYLGGLVANFVTITETVSGDVVSTTTENLNTREVFSYRDFCFAPFDTRSAIVKFDLPPYSAGVITITVWATQGDVRIGSCAVGRSVYWGPIEYNAKSGGTNFSSVIRRFDGTIEDNELVPRRTVPRVTKVVLVDKIRVRAVRNMIHALNAEPAIFAGIEEYRDGYFELFLIAGFIVDHEFDVENVGQARLSITLEQI